MTVELARVRELLYRALETELGRIRIHRMAARCAVTEDLRSEWQRCLEATHAHVRILGQVFNTLDLDPDAETPGRLIVRFKSQALVESIEMAVDIESPAAYQLVAAEALAEIDTGHDDNWELIGRIAATTTGPVASVLRDAAERMERCDHRQRTAGLARELWIESLGIPVRLPSEAEGAVAAVSRVTVADDELIGTA